MPSTGRITVIGVASETLAKDAQRALDTADLVVGGRRHLEAFAIDDDRATAIEGDVDAVLDAVAAAPGAVCVLASGDPGFFGMVRPLAARFGAAALDVHPAPSSVSLAFARLGLSWDDAVVVSAHGRPLDEAARVVRDNPKVAVLTSPASPPEAIGKALLALGAPVEHAAVCSRLGTPDEHVEQVDLETLATRAWDPVSVVVLHQGATSDKTLAWGLTERAFAHREGMITKAEVRAIAVGKLALPTHGVLWDVGAGSGSVAIECARLAPGMQVIAIERDASDVANLRSNAEAHLVSIDVVHGEAPEIFHDLPDPDRAFVGGGGLSALDAVLARLRPGGSVVATYAAIDRAAEAYKRLGAMTEVSVSRAEPLPDGGVRLQAENPVFVVWSSVQATEARAPRSRRARWRPLGSSA